MTSQISVKTIMGQIIIEKLIRLSIIIIIIIIIIRNQIKIHHDYSIIEYIRIYV